MEAARSTEGFSRRITVADANNIVTVLDLKQNNSEYQIFEKDYIVKFQVALEDLKVTVGLSSLSPAPYPEINALMSEATKQAEIAKLRTNSQKISLGLYTAKGNGPWRYESEVILMSQGSETHVPILVPFLSTNETLLVGGDFKLGVKIEPKWNQPLNATDYLVVRGTYKQVVSFSKKKDDDLDALAARIAALELALEGRLINLPANSLLGRGATAGTVERLPLPLETDKGGFGAINTGVYGSVAISAILKNAWAGIHFQGTYNANYLMHNPATGDIGFYAAQPGAPFWRWYSSATEFLISQPLRIGATSTAIKSVRSHSQVIDFPSIASQALYSVDVPVTGVTVGAYCHVVPTVNNANTGYWALTMTAIVQVAGTVSILVKNDTAAIVDAAGFWIRILIVEF
jgi:hypothetical protein